MKAYRVYCTRVMETAMVVTVAAESPGEARKKAERLDVLEVEDEHHARDEVVTGDVEEAEEVTA